MASRSEAQSAVQAALGYYAAWTTHDFDQAFTFIADDVVCDAPPGRLLGSEAFRQFMEPFTRIVTRSELVAAYGDDTEAVVIYDLDTVPVDNAPGAEYVKVAEGKITYMRIIFDRAPFEAARRSAG